MTEAAKSSPTPPSRSSSGPGRDSLATTSVPRSHELRSSLEAVIKDCFRAIMDKSILCPDRLAYAASFTKYLKEIHCVENLHFLIEVFRYEYFFEKLRPGLSRPPSAVSGSSSDVSKACPCHENPSLQQLIQALPYPTSAMKKHVRKASMRSQSNASLHSSSSSANAPFALEFDDAPKATANLWNSLSESCISDTDSDSESLLSTTSTTVDTDAVLASQWHYILDTFVHEHSPCQVNLCNKTFRALLAAETSSEADGETSSPQVLAPAKKEVLRLIYENAYSSFTSKHPDPSHAECPCAGEASGSPACTPQPPKTPAVDRSCCSTPSSVGSQKSAKSAAPCRTHGVVAPVPNKRRSKFLSSWTGSSPDTVGSPSSAINSFLSHLKPPSHSRNVHSAPQSPYPSSTPTRSMSPTYSMFSDEMARTRPVGLDQNSSSLLEKLWRKKK